MSPSYTIQRKSSYRGGTTEKAEWQVIDAAGRVERSCKTKKAAIEWIDGLTLPREEFFAKYPELRAKA